MVTPDLTSLIERLSLLHTQARRAAVQQTNYQLILRNWLIGRQLAGDDQLGVDRATADTRLVTGLAPHLGAASGLPAQQLSQCLDFYRTYPELFSTESANSAAPGPPAFPSPLPSSAYSSNGIAAEQLLRYLSFAHFLELLPLSNASQRAFYEVQTIKNNWSVRTLRRAINSLLYERIGLFQGKEAVPAEYVDAPSSLTPNFLTNPGLLEFLGLPEIPRASDSATSLVPRLKSFLLELGRGFCFEAASKRLTLHNEYFLVDLVFYHRVLRCHFLVNVRPTTLCPADTSYLNACLSHYRENEMAPDDNPPVGLLLGVRPTATLASYLTSGISAELFARQHHALLPSGAELNSLSQRELPDWIR